MSIELPTFDGFDPSSLSYDPSSLGVVEIPTISILRREYLELGKIKVKRADDIVNLWIEAKQECNQDKVIKNRTYSELNFDANARDASLIYNPEFEPTYGFSIVWRVTQRFTETEYYSDNSKRLQDFKIWEVSTNEWELEMYFENKRSTVYSIRQNVTKGVGTYSNASSSSSSSIRTSNLGRNSRNTNSTNSNRPRPIRLPAKNANGDWEVTYPVGRLASGILTMSKDPIAVYFLDARDQDLSLGTEVLPTPKNNKQLTLDRAFIKMIFDGTVSPPRRVTMEGFGVFDKSETLSTTYYPISRDASPVLIEHPLSDLNSPSPDGELIKYRPPGKLYLPNNFWNHGSLQPLSNFNSKSVVT